MEAIVFEEFGGPEVLRFKDDLAEPHAGPGQVRVKVAAVGVNPIEYKIRNGWMEQVFPVFPTALPAVPGNEFAGTVDEVGEGVTGLSIGDESSAGPRPAPTRPMPWPRPPPSPHGPPGSNPPRRRPSPSPARRPSAYSTCSAYAAARRC